MRHTVATHILAKVVSVLGVRGIPILPVKGIVTAHLLYADVAERPISDIDLRIRPSEFAAMVRIARAQGWNPKTDGPVLGVAILKIDGWEVDVESTIGPPGFCACSVAALIHRARRCIEPFGFAHLQPELHDHAILLALNAAKDGLRAMPWAIEDLRRIVQHRDFDVRTFVNRARRGRVASLVWIVADWLAKDGHGERWNEIRAFIGPRPPSRRVATAYRYMRKRGWPPRAGLVTMAAAGDTLHHCVQGLCLAAGGILRRRWLRAIHPEIR